MLRFSLFAWSLSLCACSFIFGDGDTGSQGQANPDASQSIGDAGSSLSDSGVSLRCVREPRLVECLKDDFDETSSVYTHWDMENGFGSLSKEVGHALFKAGPAYGGNCNDKIDYLQSKKTWQLRDSHFTLNVQLNGNGASLTRNDCTGNTTWGPNLLFYNDSKPETYYSVMYFNGTWQVVLIDGEDFTNLDVYGNFSVGEDLLKLRFEVSSDTLVLLAKREETAFAEIVRVPLETRFVDLDNVRIRIGTRGSLLSVDDPREMIFDNFNVDDPL